MLLGAGSNAPPSLQSPPSPSAVTATILFFFRTRTWILMKNFSTYSARKMCVYVRWVSVCDDGNNHFLAKIKWMGYFAIFFLRTPNTCSLHCTIHVVCVLHNSIAQYYCITHSVLQPNCIIKYKEHIHERSREKMSKKITHIDRERESDEYAYNIGPLKEVMV